MCELTLSSAASQTLRYLSDLCEPLQWHKPVWLPLLLSSLCTTYMLVRYIMILLLINLLYFLFHVFEIITKLCGDELVCCRTFRDYTLAVESPHSGGGLYMSLSDNC